MKKHNFHIPVMGIGYTIDTPIKVAHLGIDSVVSLVDDELIEKIRKKISENFNEEYKEISNKVKDFRALRITSYLNLMQKISLLKFKNLQKELIKNKQECLSYFSALPGFKANFKNELLNLFTLNTSGSLKEFVRSNTHLGSIDVNIMTKVDKDNYEDNEKLPTIFNDAHAALRGFANSNLNSSIVLSAGMNPKLYRYIEDFKDFYPNKLGLIKKRIILKVSDFRSAYIQGKFLAKKGIWVSEFRIESGLNCGGHAFATDGYLMGPILAEFRDKKQNLEKELFAMLKESLLRKNKEIPNNLHIKLSAQGGVGTAEEHAFLLNEYKLNSIGWGTPFLLVPEATTVDNETLEKLKKAQEKDLYLSDISPLGIPFHNLRGNTKDKEKLENLAKDRPGSSCPKKYIALNKEFQDKGLCTASRVYQHSKVKELKNKNLSKKEYNAAFNKVVEKSCTCVGLGTSALLAYNIETKKEGKGVSVCPGPNMAYFNKVVTLKGMIRHIYGQNNLIHTKKRPPIFLKELTLYVNYLKKQLSEDFENKKKRTLIKFINNLENGIVYYESFSKVSLNIENDFFEIINLVKQNLNDYRKQLI